MTSLNLQQCPICGSSNLAEAPVLWSKLIDAWQLGEYEVHYINRQQGFHCRSCLNNLRTMGLAQAILHHENYQGLFSTFCETKKDLKILEINRAGSLTPFLKKLPGHTLVEYPSYDMMNLDLESNYYDLVIHSDTLEHIAFPVRALTECKRVLKRNGSCIFTIPIIVDRLSRSRAGLPPSYHGEANLEANDQIVHTEFGADFWKYLMQAGFATCEIIAFEYPASLTINAKKQLV